MGRTSGLRAAHESQRLVRSPIASGDQLHDRLPAKGLVLELVTLAVDLTVPGDYQPVTLPVAARRATTGSLSVAYDGTPQVGATQPVTVRVYKSDSPVTDLQRYLGAYGHLVILRDGDLAYLHAHPDDQLIGGAVMFWLAVPSAGTYRAFFEFQLAGTVHTAEFTMQVG